MAQPSQAVAHEEQPVFAHSRAHASQASLQSRFASAASGLLRASSRAESRHASMQSRQARMQLACAAASFSRHSSMQRSQASTHERQDEELDDVADVDMMVIPFFARYPGGTSATCPA